jgi:hypothetical protein
MVINSDFTIDSKASQVIIPKLVQSSTETPPAADPVELETVELLVRQARKGSHAAIKFLRSNPPATIQGYDGEETEAPAGMPALPAAARLDPVLGQGAARWLDSYINYSRQWSPRAFDGFHEAAGLFVLSTVAARRITVHVGRPRYSNLYINMVARSSVWTKTTAADIAVDLLNKAGFAYLLAPDNSTPQSFIFKMSRAVPPNFTGLEGEERELATARLAFAGKRGWFYEEFGQHVRAMLTEGSYMSDFRGLLRRLDDGKDRYESSTIQRGDDIIHQPYLALFANLTPADLRPFAKRGSGLWGDGFLARFALITPPEGQSPRARFPEGERVVPGNLLTGLQSWHKRLGIPYAEVIDGGEANGQKAQQVRAGEYPLTSLAIDADALDGFYTYHDALTSLDMTQAAASNEDLDGNYTRFAEKALRIALLLASVEGCERITLAHYARAQAITERWRAGLHELYRQLNTAPLTEEQEWEDKFTAYIEKHGPATVRELDRAYHLGKSRTEAICFGLVKAKVFEAIPEGKTTRYGLIP